MQLSQEAFKVACKLAELGIGDFRSCVDLTANGHTLKLQTTDGICRIDATVNGSGNSFGEAVAVDCRSLSTIVSNLPGEEVNIAQQNGRLIVSGSNSVFKLTPAECMPDLYDELPNENKIRLETETLIQAFESVAYAAAKAMAALDGVFVSLKGGYIECVATDSRRMALFKTQVNTDTEIEALLPAVNVQKWIKACKLAGDQDVYLILGKDRAIFKHPSWTFTTQLLTGKYPDYRQVLPTEFVAELTASTKELRNALARISLLDKKETCIQFVLNGSDCKLNAETGQGEAAEQLEAEVKGEIQITFPANQLIDALRYVRNDTVTLRFAGQMKPLLIQGDDNYTALIMPLRQA